MRCVVKRYDKKPGKMDGKWYSKMYSKSYGSEVRLRGTLKMCG